MQQTAYVKKQLGGFHLVDFVTIDLSTGAAVFTEFPIAFVDASLEVRWLADLNESSKPLRRAGSSLILSAFLIRVMVTPVARVL